MNNSHGDSGDLGFVLYLSLGEKNEDDFFIFSFMNCGYKLPLTEMKRREKNQKHRENERFCFGYS